MKGSRVGRNPSHILSNFLLNRAAYWVNTLIAAEFSQLLILSLLIITTLLLVIVYRRKRVRNQPLFLSIYPLCMFILWNLSSSGVEKYSGHNLHLSSSPLYINPHGGIWYIDFNISTLDVFTAKIANYSLH